MTELTEFVSQYAVAIFFGLIFLCFIIYVIMQNNQNKERLKQKKKVSDYINSQESLRKTQKNTGVTGYGSSQRNSFNGSSSNSSGSTDSGSDVLTTLVMVDLLTSGSDCSHSNQVPSIDSAVKDMETTSGRESWSSVESSKNDSNLNWSSGGTGSSDKTSSSNSDSWSSGGSSCSSSSSSSSSWSGGGSSCSSSSCSSSSCGGD